MIPTLRVLKPGLRTTIQDLGRLGYQRFGISVSGALDSVSLSAANALVGNPLGMGALEAAYVGPTLIVEADEARLGFAGARATIEVLSDASAITGQRIPPLRSIRVRRGEVVRVGSLSGSALLYIAVEGGFDITPALGSISTDTRGSFGGWQGRALVAEDQLPLCNMKASDRQDYRLDTLDLSPPRRFRVVLGPQHDYFADSAIKAFFDSDFIVSTNSDRIGMRLKGPPIVQAKGVAFTSDGTATGSIQVTGSGQLIVLLPDRQTTGGYPKIATIISADLPALGRLPIGAKIAFKPVTLEAALNLRRELLAAINGIRDKLVPVPPTQGELSARLSTCNLISGFIDAPNWQGERIC
jgi:biotin-dependent carboxylase-like uncharacterized protein